MDYDPELSELIDYITEKSLKLMQNSTKNPLIPISMFKEVLKILKEFQAPTSALFENPAKLWQIQYHYWQDLITLGQKQLVYTVTGQIMPIEDKRFQSKEWLEHPYFNFLSQCYLLASQHLKFVLKDLPFTNEHSAKRMAFFTEQYLNAISPANFLQTNPVLIYETIQSGGKNILRGFKNLLNDLENNPSLAITMTDTKAFKIGNNLACTKGDVIFRNEMMELIQYSPQTKKVYARPLLIIPPWINKYYILDLSAENSIINFLVSQGFSVFVISWKNPDKTYAHKGLFDYLQLGPITAIDMIKKQLNVNTVNTLGFCIGGTLLACLLSYFKTHNNKSINSATFLATMIDFSDPGDISIFIDKAQITALEEKMQEKGYLDGNLMKNAFSLLRSNDLIWSFFVKNYLLGKTPEAFDILYWNADVTNMPQTMHSEYLRWMYLNNALVKPNEIYLNKTPLDISKVTTPSFFVATQKDHIAPWQTVYLGFQKMAGEKQFLLGGSGHTAGIINPPYKNKYDYFYNTQVDDNAETWLKNASQGIGSWWPYWQHWLEKKSGTKIAAPHLEKLPYPSLITAPGRYILNL